MIWSKYAHGRCLVIALPVLLLMAADANAQVRGGESLTKRHPSAATGVGRDSSEYIKGELLVRYKTGVEAYRGKQSLDLAGAREVKRANRRGYQHVRLKPEQTVDRAIQMLAADPNIAHVQPNYVYRASHTTSDPMFAQQWGLENIGQLITNRSYSTNNPGVPGNDIDAVGAWELISDCSGVVVAVLDTGVNYTHADLAANMWDGGGQWPHHGFDFIDNDDNPMPEGGAEDHGTHVAGIIGAVGNNSQGITGICQQASIMSVRVLGSGGSGTTLTLSQGIDFAVDNGASVLNTSLGGTPVFDPVLSDSIDAAARADALLVVAAGNAARTLNGTNKDYPCSFTQANVLCVAALDQSYELANFSNRGESVVDIGAPGANTLSSMAGLRIAEPLTGGWSQSTSGDWALASCSDFKTLSNASDWCTDGSTYANKTDDRVWKTFSLPLSGLAATARFSTSFSVEQDYDYFRLAASTGTGDPFTHGTPLADATGHAPAFQHVSVDLGPAGCMRGNCTVGFRLQSDNRITWGGVAVRNMSIETLEHGSTSYRAMNGTSMATPHVAGVAALVRAFNPGFTALDTRKALTEGGRSVSALDRETTSGRAVDARRALMWLDPPSAPRIQLQ